MNWYKQSTQRARYQGQLQGDERRDKGLSTLEHYQDNEVAEGKEIEVLHSMMKRKDWDAVQKYIDKLRNIGFDKLRIDSMIARAMNGVRL